ncbi:putative short-chain dehydrogenase reductase sdr protein [Neofusicoccum parvum UCRNP2]|uniref:Short-chain dehydrogenase/reductase SDR n=2 Tax=Neofusicoccum parvum TaxID=310453 RepID=A0ACB5S942_9PEZI|nr:putative short-chain dehydrogenase reductase sdr protein [Neofusicoccum parvum UCRNP2]GME29259.1 Short-chain dehydrogenase/reductase SDR [Neofusicoccum parvum]
MTDIILQDQDFRDLKDKVVLITGGCSGIGLATGLLAEENGAKVVVGDINPLPADVKIEGRNVTYLPLDVTSWDSQTSFFKKANELHGRIDHVFANAGVSPTSNFLDEILNESGELQQPSYGSFEINQKGVMNTTILALHYMKKQPSGGSIVIGASIAAIIPFPELDYSVAKHAVFGFMRSVAHNLRVLRPQPNIRINALAPSWTATGMVPAALADLGAAVQPVSVVAPGAALLMADGKRHGQTILIHNSKCVEIGDELLRAVTKKMPEVEGPECLGVFENMRDWATYSGQGEK